MYFKSTLAAALIALGFALLHLANVPFLPTLPASSIIIGFFVCVVLDVLFYQNLKKFQISKTEPQYNLKLFGSLLARNTISNVAIGLFAYLLLIIFGSGSVVDGYIAFSLGIMSSPIISTSLIFARHKLLERRAERKGVELPPALSANDGNKLFKRKFAVTIVLVIAALEIMSGIFSVISNPSIHIGNLLLSVIVFLFMYSIKLFDTREEAIEYVSKRIITSFLFFFAVALATRLYVTHDSTIDAMSGAFWLAVIISTAVSLFLRKGTLKKMIDEATEEETSEEVAEVEVLAEEAASQAESDKKAKKGKK